MESNPQPADYKSAALPIELRQHNPLKWCPRAESNHRQADFQSAALPTELPGHIRAFEIISKANFNGDLEGARTLDL